MKRVEIRIEDSKAEIKITDYEYVIDSETETIFKNKTNQKFEIFSKQDNKSFSEIVLEKIYNGKTDYSFWKRIYVSIYTEKEIDKVIPKLKRELKKYIEKEYGWLGNYESMIDSLVVIK